MINLTNIQSHDPETCTGCEDCCEHYEYDHDICMGCGHERDPGEAIDRAHDSMDMER